MVRAIGCCTVVIHETNGIRLYNCRYLSLNAARAVALGEFFDFSNGNAVEIAFYRVLERNITFPRGENRCVIGTPKTESGTRDIPIASELMKCLQPMGAHGFIIGGEEPITLSIHRRMMERINRQIDLHGASPHIFRHSYATLLNDAGASVKTIQAIIGHSDVQTTINRYVHSREDKKQEAVRSVNEMLAVQRVKQC